MKGAFLIFILALSSCAGSIKVTPKGCERADIQFFNVENERVPTHIWQRTVWTFGGEESDVSEVELENLLADEDLKCADVRRIRYVFKQSIWDQIFSVFPLIQRSTLEVQVLATKVDNN